MKTDLQLLEERVNKAYDYLMEVYNAYVRGEDEDFYEENDIEELWDYITDSYDLEYTKTLQGDFRGCRLAIALGGPNIYIDTQENRLEGYWGGTKFYKEFDSWEVCNEIDDIVEELVSYQ
ncbi:hypothetical protein [Peptoniphilus sp.]|uniref:hypothetical protein n=1 Tax=Peptoniphilus sp. TaxID=1971214 RepID=UPI0039937CAD